MGRVFVDTMIFRYAAGIKVAYSARTILGSIKSPNGYERIAQFVLHETNIKEPRKADAALEQEISHLKPIADLAKDGVFDLVYSHEVDLELLFQPLVDVYPGRLFGVPVTRISSPLIKPYVLPEGSDSMSEIRMPYSVINDHEFCHIFREGSDADEILRKFLVLLPEGHFVHQLDFRRLLSELRESRQIPNAASLLLPLLENIDDPRYREICKKLNVQDDPNSHMDAYHVWTCEVENCEYFLTIEAKLQRLYGKGPVRIVKSSELIDLIMTN